jgi:hypothetical protein
MGWDWHLKQARTLVDSQRIMQLNKQFVRPLALNLETGKSYAVDSVSWDTALQKIQPVRLSQLARKLDQMPLSQMGLKVRDIYSKSAKAYIRETIYLENESAMTRRAVVEQIISQLPEEKIKVLLEKMDQYKDQLEGLDKTRYKIHSRDTYRRIQALL